MSPGRDNWPWKPREDEPPMQDQEWSVVGAGLLLAATLSGLVWVGIAVVIWRLVRL